MQNKPNYYAIIPANVRYDSDLSPNAKLLYGEITALCSAEGFCWATNAYFADLYKVTKRSIQLWISQLENKGFIRVALDSKGPNDSSRKVYINFMGEENYTPPRKKIHRGDENNFTSPHENNFTHNNTSINTTNNNTKNNKNNRSNSPEPVQSSKIENEFDRLWKLYPRKEGKKKAFDSFKKARKIKKIPYETIENGLYRYVRHLEQQETEEQFIMHGSTWFNQEKWQDEYITTGIQKKPKNALEYFRQKYQGGDFYEPSRNGEIIDHNPEIVSDLFQGF